MCETGELFFTPSVPLNRSINQYSQVRRNDFFVLIKRTGEREPSESSWRWNSSKAEGRKIYTDDGGITAQFTPIHRLRQEDGCNAPRKGVTAEITPFSRQALYDTLIHPSYRGYLELNQRTRQSAQEVSGPTKDTGSKWGKTSLAARDGE